MIHKEKDGNRSLNRRSFFPWMATLLGMVILAVHFLGCDSKGKAPQQPQVVVQKVIQEKVQDSAASREKQELKEAPLPEKADAVPPSNESAASGTTPKPTDIFALLGLTPKGSTAPGGLSYDPKGKIDPFEPLFQQEPASSAQKKKKVRKGPLTPLERVDLSQLKLTGLILAQSGNKALIKEASGKGYIVKVGTPIGINSGHIVQILKDRIVVEEEVEDVMGNVSVQKKEMPLQKPPGE